MTETLTVTRPDAPRTAAQACHLALADRPTVAACGAALDRPHAGGTWSGERMCPTCGGPLCAACLRIADVYDRCGAWEGP